MSKKDTEFRYDALNGDWVIISPKRAERFKAKGDPTHVGECPFCNIKSQEKPILVYSHGIKKDVKDLKDWTTVVIPNKYPMFDLSTKEKEKKNGPYRKVKAEGFHEIIIFKDHNKDYPQLSLNEIEEIIDCWEERIYEFKKCDFVKAALVFHNKGIKAGATQIHPHSQILGIPLIDKEFRTSLENSEKFYEANAECLQCLINRMEKKDKKRIVFQNDDFVCYVPFAPKFAFEVVITPKKHSPRFENIMQKEKKSLAEALKKITSKFHTGLNNPDYNFYLRTSPFDKDYPHFHWYIVLIPRINIWGGFELGAGMEVSTILPEEAAEFLRKQK